MKWIGNRISFVDDKKKTTIVIDQEPTFWVNGLMGAWVAMWMTIGAIVIWAMLTLELTNQEFIILVVFMSFWFYYATKVVRSFLWLMWGKESIKIDEVALIYKKSIRNYGRAVPYYLENIQKIRMSIPKENSIQNVWESSPWVRGGERIEFDYMGKVIRFGRKLKQEEAERLFKLVTKKVDDRLKKK